MARFGLTGVPWHKRSRGSTSPDKNLFRLRRPGSHTAPSRSSGASGAASAPRAWATLFGQDFNPESYAVCGSDMLIKGHNIDHIVFGSSFTKDGFPTTRFDYLLANPPWLIRRSGEVG